MSNTLLRSLCIAFLFAFFGSLNAFAEVATAVDVDQTSRVSSSGGTSALQTGMSVSSGDVIQTNAGGQVQLRFKDNTRIVVGPNSRFTIADVTMGGGNRASQFAVDAVRGSYRFISGRSAKDVFSVRTPAATIGVRGTTFDFEVGRETAVAVLRGSVRVCGRGGSCEIIGARCSLVIARADGAVEVPSVDVAGQIVRSGFPYIANQRPTLQPAFRAPVNACSRYDTPRRAINAQDSSPDRANEDRQRFEAEPEEPVEEEEEEDEEEEEEEDEDDGGFDDGPFDTF